MVHEFITLFFLLCVCLKFCIMKKKNNCEHQKAQIRCCKYCPVCTSPSSLPTFLLTEQILFVAVICLLSAAAVTPTIVLGRACLKGMCGLRTLVLKNTWCESLLLAYCLGTFGYFPTFLSFNFLICERIMITLLLTSWVIQRIKQDLHMYS